MSADRVVLTVANTHLFRGARLTTGQAARLREGPAAITIAFRDGVRIDAEWLRSDADDFAIEAPAFRTAAGSEIEAKTWRVSRIESGDEHSVVILAERLA